MRQAKMARGGGNTGVLLIAAAALLLLLRQNTPVGNKMSQSQWRDLGYGVRARVSAMAQVVPMSANVTKAPGDPVNVTVTWIAQTVNAAGTPIPWPYSLYSEIRTFSLVPKALTVEPGPAVFPNLNFTTRQPSVTQITPLRAYTTSATWWENPVSTQLNVWALIIAKKSLPDGTPDLSSDRIDSSAVTIFQEVQATDSLVLAAAPSIPGGTITSITVAQRNSRFSQRYRNLRQ